ncbi:MAG: hypothetical protein JJE51_12700 [Thermoanaerobaculia bacterium]|nr:hypothetical protein [Thermoanaerobaculia bacterium]
MNDEVVERLKALAAKGDEVLRTHTPNSPNVIGFPTLDSGSFTGWRSQSLSYLNKALGPNHTYVADFEKNTNSGFRSSVQQGQAILRAVAEDVAAGIIALPDQGKRAATPDAFEILDRLSSRFHLVACQLRTRHADRPTLDVTDEYDLQDLLHALLHLSFDDIRPEEWTPSYAGKSSRVDFLLKGEKTVVETKKARPRLGAKELGSELIEDIARYERHPACERLYCLVYDPDQRVSNPRGFETDLSSSGEFAVRVRVIPVGY